MNKAILLSLTLLSCATAATPAAAWTYGESDDNMGRGKIKTATVNSSNSVDFRSPYDGTQQAMLIIRKHPKHGVDVLLWLDHGHFLCHTNNCDVTTRFDDNKASSFSASTPSDYSTNYIFIDNYNSFISKTKKSKKLFIEANFYKDGSQVFEFDTANLKWQ